MIPTGKIGIFDSGLGGLITLRAIIRQLPRHDFVYLGDTKHVPYGNRSQDVIYQLTLAGVKTLFDEGCELVIIACNTASTEALRKIQQDFLPVYAPEKRVLGVIIPTVETVCDAGARRVGLIGTTATVHSGVYGRELHKLGFRGKLFQVATPLLAPMLESGGKKWLDPILRAYLAPLIKKQIDTLILGCTHYPVIKKQIARIVGPNVCIVSQDTVVAGKLRQYLSRHPELEKRLAKNKRRIFYTTDNTPTLTHLAKQWFGKNVRLEHREL